MSYCIWLAIQANAATDDIIVAIADIPPIPEVVGVSWKLASAPGLL